MKPFAPVLCEKAKSHFLCYGWRWKDSFSPSLSLEARKGDGQKNRKRAFQSEVKAREPLSSPGPSKTSWDNERGAWVEMGSAANSDPTSENNDVSLPLPLLDIPRRVCWYNLPRLRHRWNLRINGFFSACLHSSSPATVVVKAFFLPFVFYPISLMEELWSFSPFEASALVEKKNTLEKCFNL